MPIRINPETGKPEWKDVGADTWLPFSSNIDNFEDITNKFTWYSNQSFGYYSNEDLSDYKLIITVQVIQPKNDSYSTFQGCNCVLQRRLRIGVGTRPDYADTHFAILNNITGIINVSGRGSGTGNHDYVAYGLK